MNKNFIFFFVASIILILSIAVLYTAPIINGRLGLRDEWNIQNCLKLSDEIKESEEYLSEITDDNDKKEFEENLKYNKKDRDLCYRQKAMHGLEYSAFTIDVIAGFICSLLGFIHYLDEGKTFITKTGLIGLVFGGIGFVITLVYLIYNILVYTSKSPEYKVDENMAYAHWENSKNVYICDFYDKDNRNSIFAKYSELGKKQYNYNKDLYQTYRYDEYSEIHGCIRSDHISDCDIRDNVTIFKQTYYSKDSVKDCTKLYLEPSDSIEYKDLNNRWLTTIILSAITIICNVVLAILGFLLFKNKEDSGEVKVA